MEEEYKRLRSGWAEGDRDRVRALHLLYLSWWHWAEPEFLTGLSEDPSAVALWHEVFDHFGGEASSDAEFLFVASIMATVTPWGLGDEVHWAAAANRLSARARQLRPNGFSASDFDGRGDYGEYFAHHSSITSTVR